MSDQINNQAQQTTHLINDNNMMKTQINFLKDQLAQSKNMNDGLHKILQKSQQTKSITDDLQKLSQKKQENQDISQKDQQILDKLDEYSSLCQRARKIQCIKCLQYFIIEDFKIHITKKCSKSRQQNKDSSISNSNNFELFSQNNSIISLPNTKENSSVKNIKIKVQNIKSLNFGDFEQDIVLELLIEDNGINKTVQKSIKQIKKFQNELTKLFPQIMGEINEVYIGLFDNLNELEIADLGSNEIQKLKLILEEYYNLITVVQVFYQEKVFTDFFKIQTNIDMVIDDNQQQQCIKVKSNNSIMNVSKDICNLQNRQEDLNQKYLSSKKTILDSHQQEKYLSSTQKFVTNEPSQRLRQERQVDMNQTDFNNFQQYNQNNQNSELMEVDHTYKYKSNNVLKFNQFQDNILNHHSHRHNNQDFNSMIYDDQSQMSVPKKDFQIITSQERKKPNQQLSNVLNTRFTLGNPKPDKNKQQQSQQQRNSAKNCTACGVNSFIEDNSHNMSKGKNGNLDQVISSFMEERKTKK